MRAYKMLGIVGGTVACCVRSFPHTHLKRTHTDTSEAHTHRQLCQLCANTKLSFPPQFWAWINKFRQNYIKMHVLVNILVNSRLRKACLNVNSGDKRHVYQYIKSVLSFLKWKKTNNKSNAVKEKYKCSWLNNLCNIKKYSLIGYLIYIVKTMQLFCIWLLYFCSEPENVF